MKIRPLDWVIGSLLVGSLLGKHMRYLALNRCENRSAQKSSKYHDCVLVITDQSS